MSTLPFIWESWHNGWSVGSFPPLKEHGVPHAVSTRRGPDVSRVAEDTEAMGLALAAELELEKVAYATQVHGGHALVVERGGEAGSADALCTNVPGLALVGKSADCPLILLADPAVPAVGFAHASWRSTLAGIVPALVELMVQRLGCVPERLWACICPSIGPECYEVGPEVEAAAVEHLGLEARSFFLDGPRRRHFDLWTANTQALIQCGVTPQQIKNAQICSHCQTDLLPSYRKEGQKAGRFMALIGLSPVSE